MIIEKYDVRETVASRKSERVKENDGLLLITKTDLVISMNEMDLVVSCVLNEWNTL